MNDHVKAKFGITILHIIGWIVLFLLPPVISQNFERIESAAPIYYYTSISLLIPIYYLTRPLLLKKRVLLYALAFIGSFILFFYLPEFVNKLFSDSNWIEHFSSIRRDFRFLTRVKQGLSVLFFITMFVNVLEAANQIKKISERDKQARTEAELAMLKTQMDPHFLFNTLNSIYYEAVEKTDVTPQAIMSLSNLMRYVLTDAKQEYVTVGQEIQYIEGYLNLQRLRLPDTTRLNWNYTADNEQALVAPLLLMPFIENAIKYGVSSDAEAVVDVDLKIKGNKLNLCVKNRIFKQKEPNGTGSGLQNVKKRLELIYPGNYNLIIDNNEGRYAVILDINLKAD